jgi:Na+/proline symporter
LHNNYEHQATKLAEERKQNLNSAPTLQEFKETQAAIQSIRDTVKSRITRYGHSKDSSDTNYIFLYFVKHNLPKGLVGLLFAVIFLASWGSISAAINSLASSSLMDIQLLNNKEPLSEAKQLSLGRWHTLVWGIFCIAVAMFATKMGSLIEAVNILGSLFYGTILGIFLVAFYVKKVRGNAVFIAALITELIVIAIYIADIISFLWLNVVGALLVVAFSLLVPAKSK